MNRVMIIMAWFICWLAFQLGSFRLAADAHSEVSIFDQRSETGD
jgi:hypothetical protein